MFHAYIISFFRAAIIDVPMQKIITTQFMFSEISKVQVVLAIQSYPIDLLFLKFQKRILTFIK